VYTALLALAVLAYCIWVAIFTYGQIRASRSLHQRLIDAVLGTTLRWLDTTPTSRILARCTRDINAVDNMIPQELGALIDMTSVMATRLLAVVVFTPVFVVPGAVLALVGGACGQVYIKAQLAVKRHMSVAHAPVLGHFGAAIVGMGASAGVPDRGAVALMRAAGSEHPGVRRGGGVQAGVHEPDQPVHTHGSVCPRRSWMATVLTAPAARYARRRPCFGVRLTLDLASSTT
jgi:ABC-type multidrug transport system fused ATPase/permease subunit